MAFVTAVGMHGFGFIAERRKPSGLLLMTEEPEGLRPSACFRRHSSNPMTKT
jgi:hypothetical protein